MSISDLISGLGQFFFEHLIIFIYNLISLVLSPINNLIFKLFPNVDSYIPMIYDAFELIKSYVVYALDSTFISGFVFDYLILSIIFKVSASCSIYIIKCIVKWYHALAP